VYKLPETQEELTVWRLAYTTHNEFLQEIMAGRVHTSQTTSQVYRELREWAWRWHVMLPGTVLHHTVSESITYTISVAGIDVLRCYAFDPSSFYNPEDDLLMRGSRSNCPIPKTVHST
jgi:hypothetical protein